MKINYLISVILLSAIFLNSCNQQSNQPTNQGNMNTEVKAAIAKASFGKTKEGTEVFLWTLSNKNGLTAKVTNYGALLISLMTPDKNGKFEDIVLGYDKLDDYFINKPYFGSTVGRFAGRIGKAKFKLDGKEYKLAENNNGNNLHGGIKGFNKVVWTAEEIKNDDGAGLKLSYLSKDGEEGFPGNLNVTVTYMLNNNDELSINYEGETDKATPVNLTHHTYFNLNGGKTDILNHEVTINSDRYMVIDKDLIPSGEIVTLDNTPLDFRAPHKVGERIAQVTGGYDHSYEIKGYTGKLQFAGRAYDAESGRFVEVSTTEPVLQFYTGNFLDGAEKGKNNTVYKQHWGLTFETQHYPDSPNHVNFPTTILKPGEKYTQTCVYKFGVQK